MRLDKWVWSVCLIKNRTLSTALCRQGKVLVNGDEGKAAKMIKTGDIIEVKGNLYRKVRVIKFAAKPIKKELAPIDYYEDLTPDEEELSDIFDPHARVNNKFRDFKYKRKKDGRVSKKDKRARNKLKN